MNMFVLKYRAHLLSIALLNKLSYIWSHLYWSIKQLPHRWISIASAVAFLIAAIVVIVLPSIFVGGGRSL